ncbi:MAG TPA: DNA glycosylase [Methanomassiliicoccales archaeon]|jgi:N-glycosylase/DNA lyase
MKVGPIDLDSTLGCGQVFRWRKVGETWNGVLKGVEVQLRQVGETIVARGDLGDDALERYFRSDDDLDLIRSEISKDPMISTMVSDRPGLRLIRQDPWECAASYVLATNANIPRIQKMIEKVCRTFGDPLPGGSFAFPRPDQIACGRKKAETCGLGFRCGRFVEFARMVDSGEIDLESLRNVDYEACHKELKSYPGIGDKVADCVAVFSLDHLEAFPVDVRIKKAMEEMYGVRGTYRHVNRYGRDYFGRFAGYAQEYIYYSFQRKRPT